jgi:hypothetical protein
MNVRLTNVLSDITDRPVMSIQEKDPGQAGGCLAHRHILLPRRPDQLVSIKLG